MKRNYHSNLAFLDLLFNTLLCFVALFAVALLIVKPHEDENKVDIEAEFMIVANWPGEINDDIDLYVEDPFGNVVFFRNQEAGLMHLDRDDVGSSGDSIRTDTGVVYYGLNREAITIRGTVPGEYVVNIHAYSKREAVPVPVFVTVEKISPFSAVFAETIILESGGEEKTACRFTLDSNGDVVSTNFLPKFFTQTGW